VWDGRPLKGDMAGTRLENDPSQLSVVVISDIRLYREGVCQLLDREPHLRVVGVGSSLETVAEENGAQLSDIVLVDAAIPDPVATIRAIGLRAPAARVIVLNTSDVDGDLLAFAEAGIAGYVTREATTSDLLAAIDSAQRGEALCSPRAAAALLERVARLAGDPLPADAGLTTRESEILGLISAGLSNKEIGSRLFIGVPTVKTHVHNILKKLGASRRGEAAARVRAGV
jgi:two-component system nitrate/nitrite response regulator NarL